MSGTLGGKLKGAAKIGLASITAIASAAASLGGAAIATASNVAKLGDNIDKMSQKMGVSAEAWQEWDFIMQHSGTSMETMKASMKTLANAAETGSDAFAQLGLSQEDIASMSQEDLFGAVIEGLQNVEDTTQRTYLAGKLLGRGATELGALLNMSAEETEAMRQSLHDMGGVMSDEAVKASAEFQDSLLDMQTAFGGFKNNLVAGFLPSISKVMQGITKLITGQGGLGEIKEGVSSLSSGILEKLPELMSTATTIVGAIGEAIIENLPTIVESGIQLIVQLAVGLLTAIPELIKAIPDIIKAIVTGIVNAWPEIKEAGKNLITFLVEGITSLYETLKEKGNEVLEKIKAGIEEKIEDIKDKGREIIDKIKQGISDAWEGLKSWFKGLWDGLFGNLTVGVSAETGGGGSFRAGGLDFVPHDNYMAHLHRGEAVLTAREAAEWRRGASGGGATINVYPQSLDESTVDYLYNKFNARMGYA